LIIAILKTPVLTKMLFCHNQNLNFFKARIF